ncbi:hypothetical protein Lal_00016913 [Lupinus albus]|nr:hypothetical protein Lal_00016913 [Lupinus albus]
MFETKHCNGYLMEFFTTKEVSPIIKSLQFIIKVLINVRLVLTDEQLQNLTLLEIEKLLEVNCKSLKDYPLSHTQMGR